MLQNIDRNVSYITIIIQELKFAILNMSVSGGIKLLFCTMV